MIHDEEWCHVNKAVMTASAAVLLLAGCGGGEPGSASPASASAGPSATAGSGTGAAGAHGMLSTNDEVRSACQAAVGEKLPGAQFATRGTLRAASGDGGKLYTVTGTAQAGGSGHPYTCEVTVTADELTVDTTTVDGQ